MEENISAIVIKTTDYRDNDKLVTLFSAERGKIFAAMRGVKKANAKLKFACQPFCFAEYVLAEKSGRYTVTGASSIDMFYSLWSSPTAFFAGNAALEMVNVFGGENMPSSEIFLLTLNYFKLIAYEKCDPYLMLIKYLMLLLRLAGYGITVESDGDSHFCFENGYIGKGCIGKAVDHSVARLFIEIEVRDLKELTGLRAEDKLKFAALDLLKSYAQDKMGVKFKSLQMTRFNVEDILNNKVGDN